MSLDLSNDDPILVQVLKKKSVIRGPVAASDARTLSTRCSAISQYIGSGIGLVPSGTKPLLEPMLTYICVAIWHH